MLHGNTTGSGDYFFCGIVGLGPQQAQALACKKVDLIEHDLDILALLLEQSSTPLEAGEEFLQLSPLVTGDIVQLSPLTDLPSAATKPPTTQRQLPARPAAVRSKAAGSHPHCTHQ